jgi:hypothetical protein
MINPGQGQQGELETHKSYRKPKLLPNISSGLELYIANKPPIATWCSEKQRIARPSKVHAGLKKLFQIYQSYTEPKENRCDS